MKKNLFIGTSGFYYEDWRGVFYPENLPKSEFFEFYCKKFDTVELNSTFYHLPKLKTVKRWEEISSEDFLFSLKAYRGITHYKKLKEVKEDLYLFLHLIKPLKEKLGMILFQLPPSLKKETSLLEEFLSLLPYGYSYALEFRHESWLDEEVFELLEKYGAAFCVNDFEKRQTPLIATSENVYIRFHGKNGRYKGSYGKERLKEWALKIEEFLSQKKRVFCYFNNDFEGAAVKDAQILAKLLLF